MKKIISLIIAVLIFTSTFLISVNADTVVSVEFASGYVLFAESFEDGIGNWAPALSTTKDKHNVSSNKATDGKNSIYILDDSETTLSGIRSEYIPVKEGTKYTMSADFIDVTGLVKLNIRFLDNDKKMLDSVSSPQREGNCKVSVTKIAPEGTGYAQLFVSTNNATLGSGYVDNIKFMVADEKTSDEPEVSVPEIKIGQVVFTESFESGIGKWAPASSTTKDKHSIDSNKATDGKNCVYILDDSETTLSGIRSEVIPVAPGIKYKMSADFVDVTGVVKINIRFLDKDKKLLSSLSSNQKEGTFKQSVLLDAPIGTVYAQLFVSTNNATLSSGYVDNIQFTALSKSTLTLKEIEELNKKISEAKPGDTIEINDGVYDGRVLFHAIGMQDKPITLKAKNPGKAKFIGNTTLSVKGSYLIVDGLLFEKVISSPTILVVEEGSEYCHIKNCAFIKCNATDDNGNLNPDGKQKYVYIIGGKYHKVSDCFFKDKESTGMMIEVIRNDTSPNYHRIENCYFGNFKEGSVNGLETIRIGTSTQSLSSSFSTISGCFFESCNGEVETISLKSGDNKILYNTFYNTYGMVCLRHGDGAEVRGNVFIGGDERTHKVTGVKIHGSNHKVNNNYFYNTPSGSQALYISNGNPTPQLHHYWEVDNVEINNNTIVNADVGVVAGEYLPSIAEDNYGNRILAPQGKMYNNAVISFKGTKSSFTGDSKGKELIFENNYVYGKPAIYDGGDLPEGVKFEKFDYKIDNGFLIPEGNVGADMNEISKAPLSPYDVMPSWVKEMYYDTGVYNFTPVKNDPFNNPDSKITDLFPIEGKINVILNGKRMDFDVEPQLINSRTMVPMRGIFEGFGAEVLWDENLRTATAKTFVTSIKITENSDIAYVNNKEVKLDSPAVIINGRFLVPVRFISESFGAIVSWLDEFETVVIDYADGLYKEEFIPKHSGIEKALTVYNAYQSGDDGSNFLRYALDGKFDTRWSAKAKSENEGAYAIFDFGEEKTLDKLYIAFLANAIRYYTFEIYASSDNVNYTKVMDKTTSKDNTGNFESYDLNGVNARYIKFTGYGSNENLHNNLAEILVTEK